MTLQRRRTTWGVIAGVLLLWLGAAAAAADDFQVEAWAIRASKTDATVSPELKPILADLKRVGSAYKGFKLERRAAGKVETGKKYDGRLIDNYTASITPQSRSGKRVEMKVLISQRVGRRDVKKLDTTVAVNSGAMQLVGGWKISGGDDLLIIGVRAR